MSDECKCEKYRKEILWYQETLLKEMANCSRLIAKIDSMVVDKYPELELTEEQKEQYPRTAKSRKEFRESYGN